MNCVIGAGNLLPADSRRCPPGGQKAGVPSDVVLTRGQDQGDGPRSQVEVIMCLHDGDEDSWGRRMHRRTALGLEWLREPAEVPWMDEKVIHSAWDQEHNTWNPRDAGKAIEDLRGGRADGKRLELLPRLRPVRDRGGSGQPVSLRQRELYVPVLRGSVQQRSELLGLPLRGKTKHDIHLCTGFVGV